MLEGQGGGVVGEEEWEVGKDEADAAGKSRCTVHKSCQGKSNVYKDWGISM